MIANGERWLGRFLSIWTGQAFSLIGSQLVQFALVWWLTIATGSATVLAVATIAAILPQVILSPLAGAYVDRWKRRNIMIGADALIALTTVVLISLFALHIIEIWHIFVVMFVRSCFSAFHWPASQAATTMLVPESQLTRVAGLNQSMLGFASILAAPLGAVLIALLPMEQVLLVDVITAAVAIAPLLIFRFAEPVSRSGQKQRITADLMEAFRYLKGWRGALMFVCMFMVINMLISPAFSLMPILIVEHFHGGALDYALTEALGGAGMIAGGILLGIWGGTKKRVVTVLGSTLLSGIGVMLIALVPSDGFLLLLGLLLFIGLMMPILNGTVMALMQACVPIGMQGRVFALLGSLAMAASPLGLAIGGPVADVMGIQPWFILAGIPMVVLAAAGFLLPSIMQIEEKESQPEIDERLNSVAT